MSALLPTIAAVAEEEEFICSTADPVLNPDDAVGVEAFGAGEEGGTIDQLSAGLQEAGLTPYGTAALADIWRRSDGQTPGSGKITLGVHFLDGSDTQKAAVRTHAVKWTNGDLGRVIAFEFDVPQNKSQISITFNTTSNSSQVGRASQATARSGISMNIGQTTERAICHEFGHALGLRHEHSNAQNPIQWNEPAVYADMARQRWTREMVQSNIFKKFGPEFSCLGDPQFNPTSIMLYPVPRRWTLNDIEIGLNAKIGEGDRKCLTALYRA